MISKEEFAEWRRNPVTEKVIELLKLGEAESLIELVTARGTIGDIPRGAHLAYQEILEVVTTGFGIIQENK